MLCVADLTLAQWRRRTPCSRCTAIRLTWPMCLCSLTTNMTGKFILYVNGRTGAILTIWACALWLGVCVGVHACMCACVCFCLSVCLSVSLAVSCSGCLCDPLSYYFTLCFSVTLCLCLCLCLCVSLSVCVCVCVSISLSLSLCPSVCLSCSKILPFFWLSLFWSHCLSLLLPLSLCMSLSFSVFLCVSVCLCVTRSLSEVK